MPDKIYLGSRDTSYRIGEDCFRTSVIKKTDYRFWNEPSSGYKEPPDTVIEEVYQADSEHGVFTWKVRARRSGFDTYLTIEDIECTSPDEKIEVDEPTFDTEDGEDD